MARILSLSLVAPRLPATMVAPASAPAAATALLVAEAGSRATATVARVTTVAISVARTVAVVALLAAVAVPRPPTMPKWLSELLSTRMDVGKINNAA